MADNVLGTLFGDIADAIRAKTGDTATMKPNEFPTKISEIEVGSGGGGETTDVIPQKEYFPLQTITPSYDETYMQQYTFDLEFDGVKGEPLSKIYEGMIFLVWLDGVLYPCGATRVMCYLGSDETSSLVNNLLMVGNPSLVNKFYGQEFHLKSSENYTEPFCFCLSLGSIVNALFQDGGSHTIRVVVVERNITT